MVEQHMMPRDEDDFWENHAKFPGSEVLGDYHIDTSKMGHPLVVQGQRRMNFLADLPETHFQRGHVYPVVSKSMGHDVATYSFGTYKEPVMLLDVGAHEHSLYPEDEVTRSVDHEVRHSQQEFRAEQLGEPFASHSDEHEAEHGEPFPPGMKP